MSTPSTTTSMVNMSNAGPESESLILPLDHPEPFASTLGIMLYPGTDDESQDKAKSFASNYLGSGPLKEFFDRGGKLSPQAAELIMLGAGADVHDRDRRFRQAIYSVGETLKIMFALAHTDEKLVSWENAMNIVQRCHPGANVPTSRSSMTAHRAEFLRVGHLWAAYALRDWKFSEAPDVNYTYNDDFQSFLAEAEAFRQWGQGYVPARDKAESILPAEMWTTPAGWAPPERKVGWPDTGRIYAIKLSEDLIADLRPHGRPTSTKK